MTWQKWTKGRKEAILQGAITNIWWKIFSFSVFEQTLPRFLFFIFLHGSFSQEHFIVEKGFFSFIFLFLFSFFFFSFFLFLFPFPFHSFSFNFHSSLRPSSFQLLFQFQNLWFYLICSVLKDGNGCVFLLVCQSGQSEFCHFDQINFGFCW